MAQQGTNNLRIYKISVRVGDQLVVRHEHGWNDTDALTRLQQRLARQGHPLATLTILEYKDIQ